MRSLVSRTRCNAKRSGAVHRRSGTATDWNDPGSAAHHYTSLRAALRLGHDILVRHRLAHSGNVTRRVARASIRASTMPTTPITRIAVITLVMERLFHSFQTK